MGLFKRNKKLVSNDEFSNSMILNYTYSTFEKVFGNSIELADYEYSDRNGMGWFQLKYKFDEYRIELGYDRYNVFDILLINKEDKSILLDELTPKKIESKISKRNIKDAVVELRSVLNNPITAKFH